MKRGRPSLLVTGGVLVVHTFLLPAVAAATPARVSASAVVPATGTQPTTPADPHDRRSTSSDVAVSRLVQACRAVADLPYAGVQQVRVLATSGERTSVVDVAHQPGSGVRLTLRPTRSSEGGTFVGQLGAPSLLPVLNESALSRITSRYSVLGPRSGPAIAGRSTEIVELVRTSGAATGTVAARFWLDRQTSLPLQRETLDGAGRVQQASSYRSISFAPQPAVPRVTQVVGNPPDLGQGVTGTQLDGFRRNGWLALDRLPDDFDLVDARVHGTETVEEGTRPTVLQLSYTDGVSVVSLFEQRGRLDAGPLAAWARQERGDGTVYVDQGRPQRMVWSGDGTVFTLVSDDPAVVESAMAVLPAPTSPPSVVERLGNGLRRLGSWLNPFG